MGEILFILFLKACVWKPSPADAKVLMRADATGYLTLSTTACDYKGFTSKADLMRYLGQTDVGETAVVLDVQNSEYLSVKQRTKSVFKVTLGEK